jgi:LysM repeat protein
MNNQSPLIPQGSLLEQKQKGRARVRIAVFFVLAVHGVGLLALLMQGCQKDKEKGLVAEQTNNAAPPPAFEQPSNPAVVASNETPAAPTNPTPVAEVAHGATPPAASTATEYTIAARDNFSTLAKKFGVTTKAIADANPGVDPTKLQIGQKIHIPAPTVAAAATALSNGIGSLIPAAGEKIYTVKSGDTLSKIAGEMHSTVKAIRTANSLKTDSINVGQKLKIPVKSASTEVASPSSVTSAPGSTPSGQ